MIIFLKSENKKNLVINRNLRDIFPEINVDELEIFLESNNVVKRYNNMLCIANNNSKIRLDDINILSNRYSSGEIYYIILL